MFQVEFSNLLKACCHLVDFVQMWIILNSFICALAIHLPSVAINLMEFFFGIH